VSTDKRRFAYSSQGETPRKGVESEKSPTRLTLAVIRKLLQSAVEDELIVSNPASGCPGDTPPRPRAEGRDGRSPASKSGR